jgi:hypothetical protein
MVARCCRPGPDYAVVYERHEVTGVIFHAVRLANNKIMESGFPFYGNPTANLDARHAGIRGKWRLFLLIHKGVCSAIHNGFARHPVSITVI